jgi:hypothetical protein
LNCGTLGGWGAGAAKMMLPFSTVGWEVRCSCG